MWETRLGAWKVLWLVGKVLWEGYAGGFLQSTRSIQLSTGPVQAEGADCPQRAILASGAGREVRGKGDGMGFG